MGQPPRRADRMSLKIFDNRLFRVRVSTVATDYKGKNLPSAQRYSVVAELMR
jgi:hypothetical protein